MDQAKAKATSRSGPAAGRQRPKRQQVGEQNHHRARAGQRHAHPPESRRAAVSHRPVPPASSRRARRVRTRRASGRIRAAGLAPSGRHGRAARAGTPAVRNLRQAARAGGRRGLAPPDPISRPGGRRRRRRRSRSGHRGAPGRGSPESRWAGPRCCRPTIKRALARGLDRPPGMRLVASVSRITRLVFAPTPETARQARSRPSWPSRRRSRRGSPH